MVIFPAELTTHEEGTRRERKTCTKRQFGRVASVIVSAEVTMKPEKIETTAEKPDRAPRWERGLG